MPCLYFALILEHIKRNRQSFKPKFIGSDQAIKYCTIWIVWPVTVSPGLKVMEVFWARDLIIEEIEKRLGIKKFKA